MRRVGLGATALLARETFIVLVLALDAILLTIRLPAPLVSDTWLALVGGRRVAEHWVPHHDTLTVWTKGTTWVDQQWLGQLLVYALHGLGGLRLVLLFNVAAIVGALGLGLVVARRSGASSRSVAVVGVLGAFVGLPNTAARTQTFAYVLFVALFWLLSRDLRSPSRRVLLALPLLVLWANVHGSAVLGAALVVLWALAQALRVKRDVPLRHRLRGAPLALAAPVCLLVSPYAFALPGYYKTVFGNGAFGEVVTEWRASTLPGQWPFFIFVVAAVWLAARKADRLNLFEHLALLGALFAGLDAVRNVIWFALVAVMTLPRALDGLWPPDRAPLRRRVNVALSLASLLGVVAAFSIAAAHPSSWYGRNYPRAASDVVAANAARDASLRVFANERYADWLLWNDPRLAGRVALDARFELLSNRQLNALFDFRNEVGRDWLGAARGYRMLVLDQSEELPAIDAVLREPGASVLYGGGHVAVLLRSR